LQTIHQFNILLQLLAQDIGPCTCSGNSAPGLPGSDPFGKFLDPPLKTSYPPLMHYGFAHARATRRIKKSL